MRSVFFTTPMYPPWQYVYLAHLDFLTKFQLFVWKNFHCYLDSPTFSKGNTKMKPFIVVMLMIITIIAIPGETANLRLNKDLIRGKYLYAFSHFVIGLNWISIHLIIRLLFTRKFFFNLDIIFVGFLINIIFISNITLH